MKDQASTTELGPRFDEAVRYAHQIHRTQKRKGTSIPYLSHLLAVAGLILEDGGDEDTAVAGLLHDVIEDNQTGRDLRPEIESVFGTDVLGLVLACSDDVPVSGEEKRPWRIRKQEYVAHLLEADPRAVLISAADKLHNARSVNEDLRRDPHMWAKFKSCKHQQVWYYSTIVDRARERLSNSRVVDALDRAVDEMCVLGNVSRVSASTESPECAECDRVAE